MSELAEVVEIDAEAYTYENLDDGRTQDLTDDLKVSRWSKYGNDRVYIEGPAKWEKNSTYLNLQTGELCDLPGRRDVTVEQDGDELTITVEKTAGIGFDQCQTIVIGLEFDDE